MGISPHSTFPVKPSEIPIFRTSPSKGYNPSTEPQNALKSPRFASALLGHLHPTRTLTCSHSAQNTPFFNIFLHTKSVFPVISETNSTIFQHCVDKRKFSAKIWREFEDVLKASSACAQGGVGVLVVSYPLWPCVSSFALCPSLRPVLCWVCPAFGPCFPCSLSPGGAFLALPCMDF